jgi:hypothetical protein
MKTCNAHEVDQVALTSRLSYTFSKPLETNPGLQERRYSFVQPIQTSKLEEFVQTKRKEKKNQGIHTTYPNEKEVIKEFLKGR